MRKSGHILIGFIIMFCSCKTTKQLKNRPLSLIDGLAAISDSTKVEGIVVKNLFKSQILAHKGDGFDRKLIIEKVYKPHKQLWDECYGMIFGEENAHLFNSEEGMVKWNKELYPANKAFFDQRAKILVDLNLDSILQSNLTKFHQLLPYEVNAKISILFTPLTGIIFGGCDQDQFCLELNYQDQDLKYTVEKGMPHELNHLAYEPLRENDPKGNTALRQTIDEGLACYFTWIFFDKEISKHEAVGNMKEAEWNWLLANEKKVYDSVNEYFNDESGDNPLLRNNKYELFEDISDSNNLYYWLGFRIIEKFVEKNGIDSWKEIYELDIEEVFKKSGYYEYLEMKK